jgi:hypothetical protein
MADVPGALLFMSSLCFPFDGILYIYLLWLLVGGGGGVHCPFYKTSIINKGAGSYNRSGEIVSKLRF